MAKIRAYNGQFRDLKVKVGSGKDARKTVELKLELAYMQPGPDGPEPIDIGGLTELVSRQVRVGIEAWSPQMPFPIGDDGDEDEDEED